MTLSPALNLRITLVGLFWLLAAWESRRDWRTVAFGATACIVAAAPTWMATQVLDHARYAASFFAEMAAAAALCQIGRSLAEASEPYLGRVAARSELFRRVPCNKP
jgi:hypothetical protein